MACSCKFGLDLAWHIYSYCVWIPWYVSCWSENKPCFCATAWARGADRSNCQIMKGKETLPLGCLLAELVIQATRLSMPPEQSLWYIAAELRTLSVMNPLCGSAPTDTFTDNSVSKCPTKLADILIRRNARFSTNNHTVHNLTGAVYSPNGFHKLSWAGINLLPPNEGAGTKTTHKLNN